MRFKDYIFFFTFYSLIKTHTIFRFHLSFHYFTGCWPFFVPCERLLISLLKDEYEVMETDEEEVNNTEEVGQMETDEEDQSSEKETLNNLVSSRTRSQT